jgi:hypothetical protein
MSPSAFYEAQGRFSGLSQADQVIQAAWYLQTHKGLARFQPKDITSFFSELHLSSPNIHVNMKRLCERRPKRLLWDKGGYYLEGNFRRTLDDKLLQSDTVRQFTSETLKGISQNVSDIAERTYLAEALNCYRAGAFRATIVMVWNLAYDHFMRWLLADSSRIADFNASLMVKYPKKQIVVQKVEHFAELKEFEAIETAQHAKLIPKNVAEIMKEKLKRRNSAAHPSGIVFTQAQADDAVTDLIHNVVTRLS